MDQYLVNNFLPGQFDRLLDTHTIPVRRVAGNLFFDHLYDLPSVLVGHFTQLENLPVGLLAGPGDADEFGAIIPSDYKAMPLRIRNAEKRSSSRSTA